MIRRIVPVIALVLVAAWSGPADAANACRKACGKTRMKCLGDANAAFKTARATCLALTGADRRTCMKGARSTRGTARKLCNKAFPTCNKSCGKGGGGGGGGGGACTGSKFGNYLASMNGYRALAGLPAVTENPAWSAGELAHSMYMLKAGAISHTEDPAGAGYSVDGATAGANGNVAGSSRSTENDGWAIDVWISGPFHAVGILDPRLAQSAFGIAHQTTGNLQTAATLDVLRGLTGSTSGLAFPILFPGNGTQMPLDVFRGNESPDPFAVCPGYTATFQQPSGSPIIAQFNAVPSVTAHSLTRDGVAVDHCLFNETTPGIAAPGPAVLAARHAVVIMPKEPLKNGSTYAVSITNNGTTTSWSFTEACP